MFNWIISASRRISAVLHDQTFTVPPDHPHYEEVKQALESGNAGKFIQLVAVPMVVNQYTAGALEMKNGTIRFNGQPINTSLTAKIVDCVEQNLPYEPLIKFLENLLQNPSGRAVKEAYGWVEHECIKVTEDGHWIGYKYLNFARTDPRSGGERLEGEPEDRDIFVDVHSGHIRQWVGKVVDVPRNLVDEDWGTACSQGLHVGSSQYRFDGDVKVLVKVNPRDMVTVPGGEVHKCRVCCYEILEVLTSPLEDTPLYTGISPVRPMTQRTDVPVFSPPAERPPAPTKHYVVKVHLRGKASSALIAELDGLNSACDHDDEVKDDAGNTILIYGSMEAEEVESFKQEVEGFAYIREIEVFDEQDDDDSSEDDEGQRDPVTYKLTIVLDGDPDEDQISRVTSDEPISLSLEDEHELDDQSNRLLTYRDISEDDKEAAEVYARKAVDFRFVRSAQVTKHIAEPAEE